MSSRLNKPVNVLRQTGFSLRKFVNVLGQTGSCLYKHDNVSRQTGFSLYQYVNEFYCPANSDHATKTKKSLTTSKHMLNKIQICFPGLFNYKMTITEPVSEKLQNHLCPIILLLLCSIYQLACIVSLIFYHVHRLLLM